MDKKEKLRISDVLWMFMLGGIIGFGAEIIWHLITHHEFLIKNGVMIGPFKPVYAAGFALMTICFYKFREKKGIWIFLLGTIIGSVFEYSASVFQEYALGTYMWNYRRFGKLAINGRIYIPYCFGWGLLALGWVKLFMMKVINLLHRIPKKINISLITILSIFMIFNLLFTAYVFYRKSARYNEIEPRNKIEEYIDKNYNDDFLDERFPNLWLSKGGF